MLGAAAAVGIAYTMKWLFGQYALIEPHVDPQSMLIAYALGVVITFATIVISLRRISCLNVVAAIRDIPENGNGKRHLRTLFWRDPDAGRSSGSIHGPGGDKASFFFMGASFGHLWSSGRCPLCRRAQPGGVQPDGAAGAGSVALAGECGIEGLG